MKQRLMFFISMALGILMLSHGTLYATHCQIQGKVVRGTPEGRGIPGVMVIKLPIEHFGMDTVITDADGNFTFGGLPGGITYHIRTITPTGWLPIDVKPGRHTQDGDNGEISTSQTLDIRTLAVWVANGCVNTDNLLMIASPADAQTYRSFSPDDIVAKVFGKMIKPTKPGQGLPNVVNVLADIVELGGFAPDEDHSDEAGGMRIGLSLMKDMGNDHWKPVPDYASRFAWIRLSKWDFKHAVGKSFSDIQKALIDMKLGLYAGPPRGLDSVFKKDKPFKPMLGEYKKITPKIQNNHLIGELIALKVNIVASQMQTTPLGFGELRYYDNNELSGLTVNQIAARADSAMTLWKDYPWNYALLDYAISKINRSFRGPIDADVVLAFGKDVDLELDGAKYLFQIPCLEPTSVTVKQIARHENQSRESAQLPHEYALDQNYPNPFNPTTTIQFELASDGIVTLKVYNILGHEVASLFDRQEMSQGEHAAIMNAGQLPSGIYFYRLTVRDNTAGGGMAYQQVRRMLLVK